MALQEVKRLVDLLEETIKTPTVLIRGVGPHNEVDSEKSKAAFELYKNMLPDEVYVAFSQDEFITVSFNTSEEAIDFCEDNFPVNKDKCPSSQYVQVWAYNESGELLYSN